MSEEKAKYGHLSIELTGTPHKDKVEMSGEKLPVQSLWINADTDETQVEITCLKLPGGDPYTIEGYLVSAEDYEWLRASRPMR